MNFLGYWLESTKMLNWSEIKPFLLDVIKTIGKSFFLVFKYSWLLSVIFIGFGYSAYLDTSLNKYSLGKTIATIFAKRETLLSQIIVIVLFLCVMLLFAKLFFSLYLTTRPTAEIKDRAYYRKYSNQYWKYLTIFIFILTLTQITYNFKVLSFFLSPFYWALEIGMFFFLDSGQSLIGALQKGFRFVFYFLPLCIIIQVPMIIYYLLQNFLDKKEIFALYPLLKSPWVALLGSLFFTLLLPIISLSLSATLYAKIKDKYPQY